MKTSEDRILTTHTGSIHRPDGLVDLMREKENGRPYDTAVFEEQASAAVIEAVRHQVEVGLDVINDGEQRKSGYTVVSHQLERLSGFEPELMPESQRLSAREVQEFPEYYERYFKVAMWGVMLGPIRQLVCRGPVSYIGQEALQIDIANLNKALEGKTYEEAFMSSFLAAGLAGQKNEYYKTREEFLVALAEAIREEYRAIVDAGFIIQVEQPQAASLWGFSELEPKEQARRVGETVEAINYSLEGIPPEKIRFHTCFGINEGPHLYDLHVRDFAEPMLRINAQAFSFEVMNPRHMHDYHAFEDVKLPDGKVIIPGMSGNGTNFVEHPELIADLTVNYANLVGRENVMIANDCGFSSQAAAREIDPKIAWAKFAAIVEGARLATERLWRR